MASLSKLEKVFESFKTCIWKNFTENGFPCDSKAVDLQKPKKAVLAETAHDMNEERNLLSTLRFNVRYRHFVVITIRMPRKVTVNCTMS